MAPLGLPAAPASLLLTSQLTLEVSVVAFFVIKVVSAVLILYKQAVRRGRSKNFN